MTLSPEKIGDKGQRYQIKFSSHADAMDDERCLGFSDDLEGAERMASAWRLRPDKYFVWIVDRSPTINECQP